MTATAALDAIPVENFSHIAIAIVSSGVTSGTGTLSVDASNDGAGYVTSIAFIDSTSTTPATRVTTKATTGNNNTQMVYLGQDFGGKIIRPKVTVATDGSYQVIVTGNAIAKT